MGPSLDQLAQHPMLALLSEPGQRSVLDACRAIYLDAGELLYEAHRPADRVYALTDGTIQIEYPETGETRGRAVSFLSAPSMLGECQVLHDRSWSGTGVALTPVAALGLERPLLESLVSSEPDFALGLYRELAGRFLHAIDSWKTTPSRGPAETLARYLIAYCDVAGRDGHVPLRQAELGRATGLRRETVNRLLKSWEREAWLRLDARGVVLAHVGAFAERFGAAASQIEPSLSPPSCDSLADQRMP